MAFKNNSNSWEQAPMLRLLLPFVPGIILYDNIATALIGQKTLCFGMLFLATLLGLVVFLGLQKRAYPIASFIVSQLCLFILAISICYIHDDRNKKDWHGHFMAQNKTMTIARISANPIEKSKTIKYELDLLALADGQQHLKITGTAFLYIYKNDTTITIHLGDTILLPNQWTRISNTGNPFEFDYRKFCQRKNIFYQQFAAADQVCIYGHSDPEKSGLLNRTHLYCIQNIEHYVTDSNTRALLKAMLLGDENDIDPNVREAYSDTGIIHIVSVSGAHVALLFIAVSFILRGIKTKKYEWLKLVAALALIWFYVLLAGASTPALRAAIMFSIITFGHILQRDTNPLNQLITAAFILLLFEPMWLFTIGFQLSFLAVLSLIIFYESIIQLWQPRHKVLSFLAKSIAASIAAEILVAPLVAYYFHSFPPMFILANIFAALAMTVILGLGMLLLIFGKINFIAAGIASIVVFISRIFHSLIDLLQQINHPVFKTIYITGLTLLLLYCFLGSLSVFLFQKKKAALRIALLLLLIISLLSLQTSIQTNHQQKLIVFNDNSNAQIEFISGHQYHIIQGSEDLNYAVKNAHIGFCATKRSTQSIPQAIELNHQKILLLDSNIIIPKSFPVDILIVQSWSDKVDVAALKQSFSPAKIVITNNQTKRQMIQWAQQCAAEKIALHNTKADGAFLF